MLPGFAVKLLRGVDDRLMVREPFAPTNPFHPTLCFPTSRIVTTPADTLSTLLAIESQYIQRRLPVILRREVSGLILLRIASRTNKLFFFQVVDPFN